MRLDGEGSETLQTAWGSVLSILMFIITGAYLYQKIDVMFEKAGVDILSSNQENFFKSDEKFGNEQGLNFAFGLRGVQGPLDPQIASWNVQTLQKDIEITEQGVEIVRKTKEDLETHTCTQEELGLDGDNTKFMPIKKESKIVVSKMQNGMTCVS